jgi:hypothetical protein
LVPKVWALLLHWWPSLKFALYAMGTYLVAILLLTWLLPPRHMSQERRLQRCTHGNTAMLRPERTAADRIHLFAHRIGLVLAAIPFLFVTATLIGQARSLSWDAESVLAVAMMYLFVAAFYATPRLVGWAIAALFD